MNTPPGVAKHRCDCDGYRPDTLGAEIGFAAAHSHLRVTESVSSKLRR